MISKGNEQEHLGKIKSDVLMMLPILDLTMVIKVMVVVTRLELCKQVLVAAAAAVAEAGAGTAAAGRKTSPPVLGRAWPQGGGRGRDADDKGREWKKEMSVWEVKKKKRNAPLTMLTEAWEGERLPKGSNHSDREVAVAKRERTARGGGSGDSENSKREERGNREGRKANQRLPGAWVDS
jgi:hypothetical protein